ncbi:hypothetical protein M3223_19915 [Paenibacillus pasadenensis]|uniref:hypothetical protein n=1 Tax=Paenibacillus pasadenensis TaxID=217090 RepID=UPI002041D4B8|nr:hypothetical protein [Paenibacillus pasadenensis]MCM3749621.1 hypothetical protein [Paenibacillus pasadenensis]
MVRLRHTSEAADRFSGEVIRREAIGFCSEVIAANSPAAGLFAAARAIGRRRMAPPSLARAAGTGQRGAGQAWRRAPPHKYGKGGLVLA